MNFKREPMTLDSWSRNSAETPFLLDPHAARLLVVDDEVAHRNVMKTMLSELGISCKTASSAAEALTVLQNEPMDAIIADLNMPEVSGLGLLTKVRQLHPQLVFLMATGVDDVQLGVEAMRNGADDYLIKPLQLDMIMASLDRAFHKKYLERQVKDYRENLEKMVSDRTEQLQSALSEVEQTYADTVDALGAAIDLRDEHTAGHSRRVCLYSLKLLRAMHGSLTQLKGLAIGASLHDIGKLGIPDGILLKPGPLTLEERRIMQQHVQIGFDLVKRIPFLASAAEIILMHHERCDGSGYPQGLKATQIPLGAKIFAVADSVDAITSDRPYRSALPFEHARHEIERQAGTLFDPQVAGVFLSFPMESWQAMREQASAIQLSAVLAGISIERCNASFDSVHNDVP
ncbi:MAG TPA: HD domain-containing phosphohydrolase [Candidatus Limnocylindria bacterium]|nr:HD domain-containing phosphohydrolase [Candidatus Limnocylindria bacterium]